MRLVLLHLSLACLALSLLSSVADGEPLEVLSAPNLLRIGSVENIFVECQECTGGRMSVTINVMNHPTKIETLISTTVILESGKNFQGFGQILIPAGTFKADPNLQQYVYLQAQFPNRLLEKVVLVSFQSGYIFIQTDKTLYTPESTVLYRIFGVTPGMTPVERNDQGQSSSIDIDIMTPDGIIFTEDPVSLESGIHSGAYKLPEISRVGVWKVIAKFSSNPQQSYSAEFEVKEYVLPSFEITLTPDSHFFYVDDDELRVGIKAMYLFGKEVTGNAYVVFGVIQGGHKISFPRSLQRVPISNGEGTAILTSQDIEETLGDIGKLVKLSLYVAVSLLTDTGSEMVEAEKQGIQIVTSPYTILFKKSPKYFKPGMSFDVVVQVLNPDGTPADNIQVVVHPDNVEGTTAANGIARIPVNPSASVDQLSISVRTNDRRIRNDRQASADMIALPYVTNTNNYLHIGVASSEVKLGKDLKVIFTLHGQNNINHDLTLLIQSRGQLVKHYHHKTEGRSSMGVLQPITMDMLPSFRIIAYYHVGLNEVVSDSAWVDVVDTCMGSLKLESTSAVPSYEPKKTFSLKITGDPGAKVGLVAVDKGVYVLNNKNRLTMTKVWDVVEKYDTGCTAGGGKNSMGVFYDAGLLFETNTAAGTPYRQVLTCPVSARRKRSAAILEVRTTLLSHYRDKSQRKCCLDGMRDLPLSYNCDRRSEYIMDGDACVKAFLKCCKTMAEQQKDKRHEQLILARSEEDDRNFMDSNDIVSRTKFPESWLWNDVILPNCADGTTNCKTTSVVKDIALQESITTWKLTGISLSRTHGICIHDTLEIIVLKNFFIDLRLPYSAVRGEQIEIKAIIHNYQPDQVIVRVYLIENENMCSSASKRGKFTQTIGIAAMTTRSVPFVIIPMKNGKFPVQVKAAVKNSEVNDGITRLLNVVPPGILQIKSDNIILDPLKHHGKQMEHIKSQIPSTDIAPHTPKTTVLSMTGGSQMSPLVENVLNGSSMANMIMEPYGCGEQNMVHMTLPLIAAIYLDTTDQWQTVGFEKRDEAINYIRTGYQNQIAFRKSDGAFAVWESSPPSSWLTAYVVKVFAMAYELVGVQRSVLCEAIKWLILNSQQPDGIFKEIGTLRYHADMMGDVRGLDTDASMTAFTLIAMQGARELCEDVNSMPGSMSKALSYLEDHLSTLTNPYSVAMVSYALANENKFNKEILMRSSRDLTHWPVSGSSVHTLEATAYALLALVKVNAMEEASPIVKWINTQRFVGGGYGSTQATIMVYQAIAEYWTKASKLKYEMEVKIDTEGKARPERIRLNTNNAFLTRSTKPLNMDLDMNVTATGTGQATLTVTSFFYAMPKAQPDCQRFNISVKLEPVKIVEGGSTYKLIILVLYMNKNKDAGMTILNIALPTSYTADIDDLNALAKGSDRIIGKYEVNFHLSERDSVIIYLDKVSHRRPDEVAFTIRQTGKVAFLQPAAVSVYEYYDKQPCVTFYRPGREQGQLLRLCRNDECKCAEEECSLQQKGKINDNERTAKACEVDAKDKIDFVYKVRMEDMEVDSITDIYKMRILTVIKEASNDVEAVGGQRDFLSYSNCRGSLSLKKDKTYLIMGNTQGHNVLQYQLGEKTWVEYWPTEEECKSDAFRNTCNGMDELVNAFIDGCKTEMA